MEPRLKLLNNSPMVSSSTTDYSSMSDWITPDYQSSDMFNGMLNKSSGLGLKTDGFNPLTLTPDSNSFSDWFFGNAQQQGKGGLVLGSLGGLGNLFMGMQQYNLAKQALSTTKEQIERNYNAQKAVTNADLEDRQRARIASNPGAYTPLSDYMNQNGIK